MEPPKCLQHQGRGKRKQRKGWRKRHGKGWHFRSLTALATTKAAAAQQRRRARQLRLQALCVAPAKRKAAASPCAAAPQEDLSIAPSTKKRTRGLFVLRLPGEQQPGRFFRFACHKEGHPMRLGGDDALQLPIKSLCTAHPIHEKASRAQRQERQPENPFALQWSRQRHRPAAATWQQFLQEVLRLSRERQPGSFFTAAATSKGAAAQWRPPAPQLCQKGLCSAPATRPHAAATPAAPFTALSTGKMSNCTLNPLCCK